MAKQGLHLQDYNKGNNGSILHVALALNGHLSSDVVALVLIKFPEQAFERDEFGRLPLTIALSRNEKSIIATLLSINPEAARAQDANGRLPLALAIENGIEWDQGLDLIVKANPDALLATDAVTGLHPFMIAASAPNI